MKLKLLHLALLPLLCLLSFYAEAQQQDSLTLEQAVQDTVIVAEEDSHSVREATLRSTIFPGLGQIYNKKYWKLPIVYGALGTTIYLAIDYHKSYRFYLDAFNSRVDNNSNNDQLPQYNESQLIELQNIFRKWRDLNLILTAAIYGLNILDAHVDAHLYNFNVNDDISVNWQPSIIQNNYSYTLGFGITVNLR